MMTAGVPLASVKSQVFEATLGFLPDWVQITVLAVVVLPVVANGVLKLRHRIVQRRAVRAQGTATTAVPYGQGSGAGFLGPYAAPRPGPSGADFLGAYAPERQQGNGSV